MEVIKKLNLYEDYDRKDVHDIFDPNGPFTKSAGTWGLQGIVAIPERFGDFVFFVTYGQKQGDHEFDEGITEHGVLTWQSQPQQSLVSKQIKQLIDYDETKNSIYLFLRTRKNIEYTYLGRLSYLSHNREKEKPVHFQWQILNWNIDQVPTERMGLVLQPPTIETALTDTEPVEHINCPSEGVPEGLLIEVEPPESRPLRSGTTTSNFRTRKVADYSEKDARNRKLGLAGEILVVEHEKKELVEAGRSDLADKVIHIANVEGDGAGYDILSYTLEGDKKFIEVKTTRGSEKTPFYMSSNEVAFSKAHKDRYYLYRIYSFDNKINSGKLYMISGSVGDHFELAPIQFRVH